MSRCAVPTGTVSTRRTVRIRYATAPQDQNAIGDHDDGDVDARL